MKRPLRVLVADDSELLRRVLVEAINSEPDMEVCAQARNGEEAVAATLESAPDVISMDLMMPKLDGVEAIRHIMSTRPTPIVVVSTLSECKTSLAAVEAGALEIAAKPQMISTPAGQEGLRSILKTLRLMAEVRVLKRPLLPRAATPAAAPRARGQLYRCLCIASSTGGPPALRQILQPLKADYPLPIVVVQHIPEGFGQGLADWLDEQLALKVLCARAGQLPQPGHVYLAADGHHLEIDRRGRFFLSTEPPVHFQRPAADRLFQSAAEYFGSALLALVLTGMGRDGADGAVEVHRRGGTVVAQDEASSAIFGMPRATAETGVCHKILGLEAMATFLLQCGG